MRKNFAMKLAVLTLIMTMITASLVSGTYSKYVTTVTGTDTARVAKFAFNLKDGTNTLTQSTTSGTYNIFNFADDSGVYSGTTSDGKKIIAPGTTGTLSLIVENLSEVKVKPSFAITETNASSIPVYYTIGSDNQRYSDKLSGTYGTTGTYKKIAQMVTDLNTSASTLAASNGSSATTTTYTLKWTWAFNADATSGQTDLSDTSLGTDGTATVNLSIATTVTQQDA